MKIAKIIFLIVVLILSVFYYFKSDEINNLLDPSNTKIQSANKHYQFGKMKSKDTLQHVFYVKNLTDDNLVVKNIHSEDGTMISDFTKEAVKEGDSAKVLLKFIPTNVGKVRKDVLLEANTSPPYTVLSISGEVTK